MSNRNADIRDLINPVDRTSEATAKVPCHLCGGTGVEWFDKKSPCAACGYSDHVGEARPCTRPPEGWWCSRGEGHEGPCAARETVGRPNEAIRRPVPAEMLAGIIAFARETWPDDGAEGETVHRLCDALEERRPDYAPGERGALLAVAEAAREYVRADREVAADGMAAFFNQLARAVEASPKRSDPHG